ncbi:hypothetical protein POPTR_015G069000v4 [Populus trichocarpa]|uniref:Uncharacterized protein n=1 Tax=Populus trichocarpa TaxID=3694 RepID=A0ACC0RVY7_POPTR|nr:hypothetical protein BDE02_15G059000 [Populus trichocarpa]KAI9381198.1 hypothetical protein POPTR_015G069000v4 [Populus trichocarpa]
MVTGSSSTVSGGEGAAETKPKEIRLFGVRVVVDNFRRNVSLNNVTEYQYYKEMTPNTNNDNNNEEEDAGAAVSGYMSADDTVHRSSPASGRRSERKRGVPWTEEEHRRFLFGLQKVGKGDWRGISRNFVKTRNPTQVASHAQKHFLRLNNVNRRRRRTSLFDITADTVATSHHIPSHPIHAIVLCHQLNCSKPLCIELVCLDFLNHRNLISILILNLLIFYSLNF